MEDKNKEVIDTLNWWKKFEGNLLIIKSKKKKFIIKLNEEQLPHLLGLQYINNIHNKKRGRQLYNQVLDIDKKNENIYDLIAKNNIDKLESVKDRINNFEKFFKNLENGIVYENTNENTTIKSNFFIVEIEKNKYLQLGVVENERGESYFETYFLRKDDLYFKNSKIKEPIIGIYKYNDELELEEFSFDEEKMKKIEILKEKSDMNKENILNKIEDIKLDGDYYGELKYQLEEYIKYEITEDNKNDIDLFDELIQVDSTLIKYASEELKDDKEFLLNALERENEQVRGDHWGRELDNVFKHASDRLKNNKEVVMVATKYNPLVLKSASERLKNDKEVVINAINENSYAFNYMGEDLKQDKKFLNELMDNRNVQIELRFFDDEFRDNEEFVKKSMKYDVGNLSWASDRLKNDKEFILESVRENGFALNFVRNIYKDDKEVIIEASKDGRDSLFYASDRLKNDKEVVKECIKNGSWYSTMNASTQLRNNEEFIKEITEINPIAFTFATDIRQGNLYEKLVNDMDFMDKVLISAYENDEWESKTNIKKEDFIDEIVKLNPDRLKNTISEYKKEKENEEIANDNPWDIKIDDNSWER